MLATDLYYASVLDLKTMGCFLELHEMRFAPRPVDFLLFGQLVQSASENA
jgi:hypothetical protein